MPSTKLLKERIESIQDTMKITNAMYLISSSKLRKARKNYQNVLPYFTRMRDTISRVVPHLPEEPVHPFFHVRDVPAPKRAYVVLTADKGMAGAFNQNTLKFLKAQAGDDPNAKFYVIGQVGYRALLHKDPRLVEEFQYSATAPSLQRARDITVDAIDDFKAGNLDEIYLIYTKIQNALTSEPVMVRLLPLDRDHLQPAPKGLGDPKGDVEMFPDAWTVFEQTAPIYMHGMIFGAMTESFCRAERPHDRHGFRHQERHRDDPRPAIGVQPHPAGLHHPGDYRDHRRRGSGTEFRITSPSSLTRCHLPQQGSCRANARLRSFTQ